MLYRVNLCLVVCAASLLASCGNANRPPSAFPGSASLDEDSEFFGFVYGVDAETPELQYFLATSPMHGEVAIDRFSGAFRYTPRADFYGMDAFQFQAWDGQAYSKAATVQMSVSPVNDAPVARPVADQKNSAYTLQSVLPLPIADVDGDVLSIAAVSSDSDVAQVTADAQRVTITPTGRGSTTIRISASDGQYAAETEFEYVVGDVTRRTVVSFDDATPRLIAFRNNADRDAVFTLTFNGNRAFASASEAAEHVRQMEPQFEGEGFARKLWRFVRDNTYHNVPINADHMWNDMWTTMNSLGWGFCSHVSAVYVEIARAAGYEARIWGLSGHVVPEIHVNGRWEMYDPDLAAYYMDYEGNVAGVEQLAQDPSLITSPIDPVLISHAEQQSGPYRPVVAEIYGTPENNFTNNRTFNTLEPGGSTIITLPVGARLLLPGKWTPNPIGYDGSTPYVVPEYRQAALRLPAGWVGSLPMPWVLWDVQGSGSIRVRDKTYIAGDPALAAFLRAPGFAITDAEIVSGADGLQLIFMINAMWYDILPRNEISVHGQDVWAVAIGERETTEDVLPDAFPEGMRKPSDAP